MIEVETFKSPKINDSDRYVIHVSHLGHTVKKKFAVTGLMRETCEGDAHEAYLSLLRRRVDEGYRDCLYEEYGDSWREHVKPLIENELVIDGEKIETR